MDTREIVEMMVAAINGGRAEKVAERMHPRGVFVDSLGRRIEGRAAILEGWRAYYRMFPDYRIEVDGMMAEAQDAMLHGRGGGTLHRDSVPVADGGWQVPAAWRAVSDGARLITHWQVFADNAPVRTLLQG